MGSTNRYLLEEARSGSDEGLVAVADVQSAGRGRLSRTWESPPGTSLLMSVLLRPGLPPGRLHLAMAAMALAGAQACLDVAGVSPGIKWPNDLVLGPGEGKLAGVLAEVDGSAVVVGLGLNVDWPITSLPPGAACLGPVDREALLEAVLAHLALLHGDWSLVVAEYRRRCVTVGQVVRVELATETFTGMASAVSDDGHLLVARHDRPDRVQAVAVADVVHLRPDLPN